MRTEREWVKTGTTDRIHTQDQVHTSVLCEGSFRYLHAFNNGRTQGWPTMNARMATYQETE